MNIQFNSDFTKTIQRERIAFIQSCWHRDIVDNLRDAFMAETTKLTRCSVDFFEVPGAFEIPLRA